jgi:hypothetical protein
VISRPDCCAKRKEIYLWTMTLIMQFIYCKCTRVEFPIQWQPGLLVKGRGVEPSYPFPTTNQHYSCI